MLSGKNKCTELKSDFVVHCHNDKVNGMKKGLFPYVSTMDKPFLYHLPLYILRPLFFRSTMTFSIFPSFISVF